MIFIKILLAIVAGTILGFVIWTSDMPAILKWAAQIYLALSVIAVIMPQASNEDQNGH